MNSSHDALVADLETAHEELRVADEEVRAQQEAIKRLVESHQSLRLQQERTMAILPVPIVVTDMYGIIRSANAAAASLVGRRVSRLLGKPIFVLFASPDRPDLRRMVAGRGSDALVVRRAARLVSPDGDGTPVEVTASVQFPGAGEGEIGWLVLAGQAPLDEVSSVTASLTQLAMLARHGSASGDVLEAAVRICSDALHGRADLSVALGSPLEPAQVVSSSLRAQESDGAQVAAGEGPSETAYRDGLTTMSPDARDDARWPRLTSRLPEGRAGVIAAPIRRGDEVIGTVTAYLHGDLPAVPRVEEEIELFAVTLGGVLHELGLVEELERLEGDLHRAVDSRAVIDQAKGIIMAARGVTADEAWRHLVQLSSTTNVKVREVAQGIVDRATAAR